MIKHFSIDKNKSNLIFNEQKQTLDFQLVDFTFDFELDFALVSKPKDYIKDIGVGSVEIAPTSIGLSFAIKIDETGRPVFDCVGAEFNYTGMNFNFTGTADYSKYLSVILNKLSGLLKDQINDYLTSMVNKFLIPTLNKQLN